MFNLAGKISDRIRGGKLPKGVKVTDLQRGQQPAPKASSVRRGEGHMQGKGSARSGPGAE